MKDENVIRLVADNPDDETLTIRALLEAPLTPEPKAGPGLRLRNRHFLALDLVLVSLAPLLAFSFRFEGFDWAPIYLRMAAWYLTLTVPLKILLFFRAGLYKHLWRYAGMHAVERILKATALSGLIALGIGAAVIPAAGLALAASR